MKLNYKRTIFVGFAFFLICSFWQAYDNTIPLILTNKFGMSQAWSGVIMALDNVLALFMLPLFGAISDKHHSKWGRRTPFIVVGTLVAAVMLIALSFVDNAQLKHLSDVSAIDDPAALEQIYDRQADETLLTPGGDKFVLSQKFTQEEFCQIRSQVEQNGSTVTNPDYTNYVVPARQACAWDATAKSPVTLVFFIVLLLIVLVSMAVFRSPAVALMPDVTPKPLRSEANAVINLMGAMGGVLYLLLAAVLYSKEQPGHTDYYPLFAAVAAIMVLSAVVVSLTVREPSREEVLRRDAEETAREQRPAGNAAQTEAMPAPVRRSLGFLLLSIALWFIGYNAVETWFTTYASQVWGMALGESSVCLTIAMAGAIASYVPVGALAGRIGRKNTILLGTALLTASFFCAFLSTLAFAQFSPVMYVLFVMVGIAWAAISVNSLPMVVEMCRAGDVGRFTGYYYTFSMAAQTITPIAAGWLLRHVGYDTLFPYAAIFSACSMLTMFFVRHGDSRLTPKGEEART